MSTPENSSSESRATSRMDPSDAQGQEPSAPPDPPSKRFTGAQYTSRPRRSPRPSHSGKEETAEEETARKEETAEGGPETETAEEGDDAGVQPEEGQTADAQTADAQTGDAGEEDKSNGDRWDEIISRYEDGPRREARRLAARAAMAERTFATPRHSEELHVLNPSTTTYGPGGPQALKELLVGKLGPHYSRREARKIADRIRAETYVDGLDVADAIPLWNGDLSVQPTRLTGPAPERRFSVRSPARWTEGARCPTLKNLLQEAVPNRQDRRALQEYLGYCLMHWARPYRRVLLLAGPEGSGWAPFLQAVSAVVPWVASAGPKRLASGRGGPQLRGPWVNARAGISPEALTDLQILRGHVAGRPAYSDPGKIREIKQTPSSQLAAKHIFAATGLPPLAAGDRFFRRILLVPFPATLPSETLSPEGTGEERIERFKAERDGILRWAVAGLERILENGGFPSERSPEETRRRWESLSGPIGRFKADRLKVTGDPQDVVPKDTLYPVYKQFCRREAVFAETKKQFTKTLTQDPRIESRKRTPEPGGDQVRCYVGVKPRNP